MKIKKDNIENRISKLPSIEERLKELGIIKEEEKKDVVSLLPKRI